jgi:hypothetical protein
VTLLRPAGRAEFDGEPLDVVTEGDFIRPGEAITITGASQSASREWDTHPDTITKETPIVFTQSPASGVIDTVQLFMRNVRSTFIAAVAIPTSLIATFALMRWQGFTLNNITLADGYAGGGNGGSAAHVLADDVVAVGVFVVEHGAAAVEGVFEIVNREAELSGGEQQMISIGRAPAVNSQDASLLSICENGYGKRTEMDWEEVQDSQVLQGRQAGRDRRGAPHARRGKAALARSIDIF